jgi:cytochrome c
VTRRPVIGWLAVLIAITLAVAALGLAVPGGPGSRFTLQGASAGRGEAALGDYGCGSCHAIPGVRGADAHVGPPLANWAERAYVAGHLPNRPAQLVRWIEHPQRVEPGTAMPDLGVPPKVARDMAQYLYTLH